MTTMIINRAACLEACATEGGELVGRDPRRMGRDALQAAGFEPMSLAEAIRAKCLDCCAGSAQEVRYCVAVTCPSWPYRMGLNPFRAERSAAQIEAARKAGARMAVLRAGPKKTSLPEPGLTPDGSGDRGALLSGPER